MSETVPDVRSLPWLEPPRQRLREALQRDRLPAALLLQIDPGLGGESLARWCAAALFCKAVQAGEPCGQCLDCRRVASGEQPDLMLLSPLEESKEIKIDQVREAARELALTSHSGRRKVVIISPAEKLNRNAANALLKTLEEPAGAATLMLVTGEPSRLPQTVQSRCMRVTCPPPATATLVAWLAARGGNAADWAAALALHDGRPLAVLGADAAALAGLQRDTHRVLDQALQGALDPVETAEAWSRDEPALRVAAISAWLRQRIDEWANGQRKLDGRALLESEESLRELRGWLDTPVNKALALERLLWRLGAIVPRATTPSRHRV